jgi:hypothetical protein
MIHSHQRSRNIPEYFVVGHDIPETLYDRDLLETGRNNISILMAGIGDARHLHHALQLIGVDFLFHPPSRDKVFHFTILDHKPAVIARDLVILLILGEISRIMRDELWESKEMFESFLLPCLYYIYLAPIKVLKEWQSEALSEFGTARVRKEAVRLTKRAKTEEYKKWSMKKSKVPAECRKQAAFYRETGILLLDFAYDKFNADELNAAFDAFDEDSKLQHTTTTNTSPSIPLKARRNSSTYKWSRHLIPWIHRGL